MGQFYEMGYSVARNCILRSDGALAVATKDVALLILRRRGRRRHASCARIHAIRGFFEIRARL